MYLHLDTLYMAAIWYLLALMAPWETFAGWTCLVGLLIALWVDGFHAYIKVDGMMTVKDRLTYFLAGVAQHGLMYAVFRLLVWIFFWSWS